MLQTASCCKDREQHKRSLRDKSNTHKISKTSTLSIVISRISERCHLAARRSKINVVVVLGIVLKSDGPQEFAKYKQKHGMPDLRAEDAKQRGALVLQIHGLRR